MRKIEIEKAIEKAENLLEALEELKLQGPLTRYSYDQIETEIEELTEALDAIKSKTASLQLVHIKKKALKV